MHYDMGMEKAFALVILAWSWVAVAFLSALVQLLFRG